MVPGVTFYTIYVMIVHIFFVFVLVVITVFTLQFSSGVHQSTMNSELNPSFNLRGQTLLVPPPMFRSILSNSYV